MNKYIKHLCLAGLIAGVAQTASAEDTITLRMGTFLPSTHVGVTQGSDVFISELKRLTNDKVKVEFYPAQQAGKAKESLDLVKMGAIDIAEIGTGYYSGTDVPLWGLIEIPNLVHSVCDGTRAMRKLGDPGGIMWKSQYAPQGIRILSYYVYPPYGPTASRKEITKVDDLKGLKLRNTGGLMERTVTALGGIPINMTSPEVLQSLQRGTLDSWLGAYMAVKDYEFYRYAKYGVKGFSMGTPGIFAAISESKFESFPKDVQDALVEAGKKAEENFCAYTDKEEAASIEELQTPKYGMKIYTWTPEQVKELTKKTSSVVDTWVNDLEGRGVPAREALKDFKAALPQN